MIIMIINIGSKCISEQLYPKPINIDVQMNSHSPEAMENCYWYLAALDNLLTSYIYLLVKMQ